MKGLLVIFLASVVVAQSPSCQNDGTSVDGVCKCKKGYTGKHCEIAIKCCLIYGDPHFLTFDGANINFQGSCSYQAAGVCPCIVIGRQVEQLPEFNVMVDTWRKGKTGSKVSWTRSVTVQVYNHTVTIDQGADVKVNGARVMLPYRAIPHATLEHTGDYVRMSTEFGASVSFDGVTRALICVPEKWQGKTCGICGNNNGNKLDDFVTRDGTDVYSRKDVRDILIGNSWRDLSKDTSDCLEDLHEIKARPAHTWVTRAKNNEHCGSIVNRTGPFAKCIEKLGNIKIMAFYEDCLFDVYESQPDVNEAHKMACNTLDALVTECREMGTPADKSWRDVSNCVQPCPKNFRFSADAPACPATCSDPEAPKKCEEPNTEGCVCKPGLLLASDECVMAGRCGCTDEHGSYHKLKAEWFDDACTTRFRCRIKGAGGPQIFREAACGEHEMCKAIDGQVKCVTKPVPGGWSAWGEWSECQSFGADEGLVKIRMRTCNNPAPKYGGKCEGKTMETLQCLGSP